MRKLMRARRNLATEQKKDTAFTEDTSNSKYPKGVAPYKCNESRKELATARGPCTDKAELIQFEIKHGANKKKAMARFHYEYAAFCQKVEVEAIKEHIAVLEPAAKKSTLNKDLRNIILQSSDPNKYAELGLDQPTLHMVPDRVQAKFVEEMYKVTIDKIQKEEEARIKKLESEAEAKKQDTKKLLAASPTSFWTP